MRKILVVLVAVAACLAPAAALADRGWRGRGGWHHPHHRYHPRVAFGYGAPLWWGAPVLGWGYGWGWPPPVVVRERVIEREPPVYIERGRDDALPEANAQASAWYFCRSENAYYPDVERCPEAWIPVPARSE